MKKNFKYYALIWAVLFAVWCAVVFLVRPIISEFVYDSGFWIAFAFIVLTFIGNLVCAYFTFKAENLNKVFLNLPLISISSSALITMVAVGSVLMLIPNCPAWIVSIICIIIFAFNAITVIKAVWAANTVGNVEDKIKAKTSFIKNLTVDAESILSRANNESIKALCKKVYEAVRYSDPMSNDELSVIEAKITVKMDEYSSAVSANDVEKAKEIADEIIILVADRNRKCKAIK